MKALLEQCGLTSNDIIRTNSMDSRHVHGVYT